MALRPQNEDAFFREVDDELRRDQLAGFWQRYGKSVAAGVIVFLIALAGIMVWQRHRAAAIARDSEALSAGLDALSRRDAKAADTKLKPLGSGPQHSYAALADLALASASAARNEPGAGAAFARIANDATAPEPLRQAALVRHIAIDFDTLPPADVIRLLKPMAVAGNPWFGSAGELSASAQLKLGRTGDAAKLFAAVARDAKVPETIRGRAARMAAAYGIEVAPAARTAEDQPS